MISDKRFDALVERARLAAMMGSSDSFAQIFSCVLNNLIANEYSESYRLNNLATTGVKVAQKKDRPRRVR